MLQTSVSRSEASADKRSRGEKLRRFGIAGGSALLACVATCTVPVLAVALGGGGVLGGLARILRPGLEPVVGAVVFVAVLGGYAIARRRRRAAGCGTSCNTNRSCG